MGASLYAPETPLLKQFSTLRVRVRQHNGSDPFVGRRQRQCMLAAGFVRADATASMESAGTLEETRRCAATWQTQLQGFARTAIAEGWVDSTAIAAIAAGIDAWAERPDAFMASTWCEAVGWVTA